MSYVLAVLLVVIPQHLGLPELVNGVSRTYSHLKDFSADFEQISEDFSNQTLRERGHVYLKSGKRARFEYVSPERKFLYFDGKTYTKYTPAVGQAIQRPISKSDSELLTVFQIVGNPESPWKDQFPRQELLQGPAWVQGNRLVRLIPGNKDLPEVLIEVDPEDFLIHRFVMTYADGEQNEFRFTDIRTAALDQSLFRFQPPPGVEVIEDR